MSGINNEYNEQEIAGSVSAGTSMFSDLFRRFGQPPMVVPEANEECRTYYQEILHIKAQLEQIDASNRGIDRIVVNADGTLTVYYSDGTTYTSPSLKGADGQDGQDGAPGQDGQDGAPGRDGVDGQDGADGQDGQDGVTPNITVTATVDNTPGVAEVSVVKSGTDANPIFAFNFLHVKGNTGATGQPGQDGVSPTAYVTQTGQNEVTITVIDANGTTTATLTGEAGAPGRDGQDGQDGEDGVSPIVTVTDITGGHRVTISDADGSQSFDVLDGTDGQNGTNGTDGVSPTVTVTDITGGHQVSITDATSTQTFNVMNGSNGTNGQDGVSPTIAVTAITGGHQVAITDAQGTDTFNVLDGQNGTNGSDGQDGVSPTIDVVTVTGGHRVDITDAQGSESFTVLDGQDGQNGTNGQDGVTPDITMTATADATSSANPTVTVTKSGTAANPAFALAFSGLKGTAGTNGQGVPAGGTAGQVLQKVDGTDYNTEWVTPQAGGGGLTFDLIVSNVTSITPANLGAAIATARDNGAKGIFIPSSHSIRAKYSNSTPLKSGSVKLNVSNGSISVGTISDSNSGNPVSGMFWFQSAASDSPGATPTILFNDTGEVISLTNNTPPHASIPYTGVTEATYYTSSTDYGIRKSFKISTAVYIPEEIVSAVTYTTGHGSHQEYHDAPIEVYAVY